MGRRAAESVAPSRPSTPPVEQELDETPFWDSVEELQQHVRDLATLTRSGCFSHHLFKGINMQDILKLKVTSYSRQFAVTYPRFRALLSIQFLE
ncbi:hypothetical protein BJ322DRAFT_803122 [Thelephora terrestris]|uniref:Uncharacterized protein n=1 Tax=Thelephora terrestris TaxID=56493 RepID=A0A9P6HED2_9AGAM|nr:hypothetical protein BJ322DRAFT_803122 [Thelephora terrestris]